MDDATREDARHREFAVMSKAPDKGVRGCQLYQQRKLQITHFRRKDDKSIY